MTNFRDYDALLRGFSFSLASTCTCSDSRLPYNELPLWQFISACADRVCGPYCHLLAADCPLTQGNSRETWWWQLRGKIHFQHSFPCTIAVNFMFSSLEWKISMATTKWIGCFGSNTVCLTWFLKMNDYFFIFSSFVWDFLSCIKPILIHVDSGSSTFCMTLGSILGQCKIYAMLVCRSPC